MLACQLVLRVRVRVPPGTRNNFFDPWTAATAGNSPRSVERQFMHPFYVCLGDFGRLWDPSQKIRSEKLFNF